MPTLFVCTILFAIWLLYARKRNTKQEKKSSAEFWEREHEADMTPRQTLDDISFIQIPYDLLPFDDAIDDSELRDIYQTLRKLEDKPIADLSAYSNTDLKLRYGTANFDKLSLADGNFNILVRTLNKWGELLSASGNYDAAKTVLIYAIQCGSDVSATFTSLAAIYVKEEAPHNIEELIDIAETIKTLTGPALVTSLKVLLNNCLSASCHAQE